jgi:hypothetical protein
MHDKHRLETIAFARVPARWNHLIEKNARKINGSCCSAGLTSENV